MFFIWESSLFIILKNGLCKFDELSFFCKFDVRLFLNFEFFYSFVELIFNQLFYVTWKAVINDSFVLKIPSLSRARTHTSIVLTFLGVASVTLLFWPLKGPMRRTDIALRKAKNMPSAV